MYHRSNYRLQNFSLYQRCNWKWHELIKQLVRFVSYHEFKHSLWFQWFEHWFWNTSDRYFQSSANIDFITFIRHGSFSGGKNAIYGTTTKTISPPFYSDMWIFFAWLQRAVGFCVLLLVKETPISFFQCRIFSRFFHIVIFLRFFSIREKVLHQHKNAFLHK